MGEKISIFWFRRDLRLEDNAGFSEALNGVYPVVPLFIFDPEILDSLSKDDPRVSFIHDHLQKIRARLLNKGSSLAIYSGKPVQVFKKLIEDYPVAEVYTNRDYEPYATERDHEIDQFLKANSIKFNTFKDHVIFEKDEIVKKDGQPYVVYTPYMKLWKERLSSTTLHCDPPNFHNLLMNTSLPNLHLAAIGFQPAAIRIPPPAASPEGIENYEATRNFPAADSTSRIGVHLRFGTLSIREMVKAALGVKNETFLEELIWREFFIQILAHFPYTVTRSFKPQYDRIAWRNNKEEFELWKAGKTGYPLVDAGMRQLNSSGFMHNRVRMLTASFLCKHLLIDWRWGEAYFAEKLLDYEMASNVGNWQWAAGSGVDAAPYFRIFNPTIQLEKIDRAGVYIKKWVPEIGTAHYPERIVDHKEARERALKVYKAAVAR